jgi:hypothetical protein
MKLAIFSVLLLVAAFTACNQKQAPSGYLVTRSEAFTHHYVGNPCGLDGKEICDKEELRFTFTHNGVKFITHCQSWSHGNSCGQLVVGKAYQCDVDNHANAFGPQLLSCENHAVLGIESSEIAQ